MDQYIIKGGTALAGEVVISGAKNSALGILAAAVLTEEEVCIKNLPDIRVQFYPFSYQTYYMVFQMPF